MKGYAGDERIKYTRKPPKITVEEIGKYSCCDNCASYGQHKTYAIHFSNTDYALPSGNIGKNRYAKPRQLWLCEYCFKELKDGMDKMNYDKH